MSFGAIGELAISSVPDAGSNSGSGGGSSGGSTAGTTSSAAVALRRMMIARVPPPPGFDWERHRRAHDALQEIINSLIITGQLTQNPGGGLEWTLSTPAQFLAQRVLSTQARYGVYG